MTDEFDPLKPGPIPENSKETVKQPADNKENDIDNDPDTSVPEEDIEQSITENEFNKVLDQLPEIKEDNSLSSDDILIDDDEPPINKKEEIEVRPGVKERHHKAILEKDYETDSKPKENSISIDFPSQFLDKVSELVTTLANFKLDANEDLQKWGQSLEASTELNNTDDILADSLERENSDWHQYVESNGRELEIKDAKLRPSKNKILSGEKAALAIMTHLGLGGIRQIPLWHSGIWVTIKTPKEADIVELFRQIGEDTINLGRSTYGSIYANTSVAIINTLIEFVSDHIQNTTCNFSGETTLKDIVKVQDIYPLIWGLICTMFPKGFHYTRPCIDNPEKCSHVLEKKLDVRKLLWVDRSVISEEQAIFMSKRNPSCRTVAEVRDYQEKLKTIANVVKEINHEDVEPIKIELRSPSISDYLSNGNRWINSIIEMVEGTLAEDIDPKLKEIRLERHAQATIMRQYNHWVESIEINTNVIEDRQSIDKALDVLSSNDEIRSQYNNFITDYINSSTMALIGIPAYNCPECETDQSSNIDETDPFVNIIPIDVIMTFFGLSGQLVERIAVR